MSIEPAPIPIVQTIPHAGLAVPEEVAGKLAIDEVAIWNECDLWADQLYDLSHPDLSELRGDRGVGLPLAVVGARVARAIVDVNRPEASLENPDGAVKSVTSYGEATYRAPLDGDEKRRLVERYWRPFHDEVRAALEAHAGQARLLLDCHSMAQVGPDALHDPGATRPLIGLGNLGDGEGEPRAPRGATTCPGWLARAAADLARERFADVTLLEPVQGERAPVVALNSPFPGGHVIDRYARHVALMVEVNRGLYVGRQERGSPRTEPDLERIADLRRRLLLWTLDLLGVIESRRGP